MEMGGVMFKKSAIGGGPLYYLVRKSKTTLFPLSSHFAAILVLVCLKGSFSITSSFTVAYFLKLVLVF